MLPKHVVFKLCINSFRTPDKPGRQKAVFEVEPFMFMVTQPGQDERPDKLSNVLTLPNSSGMKAQSIKKRKRIPTQQL